jgi:hypothetical protein
VILTSVSRVENLVRPSIQTSPIPSDNWSKSVLVAAVSPFIIHRRHVIIPCSIYAAEKSSLNKAINRHMI